MEVSEGSLADAVESAVSGFLSQGEGGVMTNFVFVAEFMDADGGVSLGVVAPGNASTPSALGLSHYGVNFFTEQQRQELFAAFAADDEE